MDLPLVVHHACESKRHDDPLSDTRPCGESELEPQLFDNRMDLADQIT